MTETTRTVELPLTKSEQRHLDNVRRRDEKRERATKRRTDTATRDAKLKAINDEFTPKIDKLQAQRAIALKKVWDEWREVREAS